MCHTIRRLSSGRPTGWHDRLPRSQALDAHVGEWSLVVEMSGSNVVLQGTRSTIAVTRWTNLGDAEV